MPGERTDTAILIGLAGGDTPVPLLEEHLEELERLVDTAGGRVVARLIQARKAPDPGFFIGRGKVTELSEAVDAWSAGLVVADGELSPVQIRNLQDETGARVIDRTDLILEIFARHARTREAKISVELALLEQQLPRLAGQWYGLSRQGGGIGARGLGESRLELDRRVARTRIAKLKEDLGRIEISRGVHRKARQELPIVALAGYTNAGKSTLFTSMTSQETYAADRLFATLDSRHARLPLDAAPTSILVDTVGFIRKLPHQLVASFRSTLGELREADLVLHVVDASHPASDEQMEIAGETFEELGVDPSRILLVFNKVDRLPDGERSAPPGAFAVSAVTKAGLVDLRAEIARRLTVDRRLVDLDVDAADGRSVADLRREAEVLSLVPDGDRLRIRARISPASLGRLLQRPGVRILEER